jgi:uncharacterized protein YjbI with pentapeptide repeats
MKQLKLSSSITQMNNFIDEEAIYDCAYTDCSIDANVLRKLDGCRFKNCKLTNFDFSQFECLDVLFDHCEFVNVHFESAYFCRVHFINCRISGMILSDSTLQDCLFASCKGNYCNFGGSYFKDCILQESDFSSSGFIQCTFKKIQFKGCDFSNSDWFNTSLKGLDFSSSVISNISVSTDSIPGVTVNEEQALEFVKILGIQIK